MKEMCIIKFKCKIIINLIKFTSNSMKEFVNLKNDLGVKEL